MLHSIPIILQSNSKVFNLYICLFVRHWRMWRRSTSISASSQGPWMLSLCLCSLTSSRGQTSVTVPKPSASSTAPPGDWHARPPTPPKHTPTHNAVNWFGVFSLSLCSRHGHRANTSRAQLSMAKVCSAPGNLEARHTEANRAALRDRLSGGDGWA